MNEENFEFNKKIGISPIFLNEINILIGVVNKLLICMKETNEFHKRECQFFTLDFRQSYNYELDQFPLGSLILDLKWGNKEKE